MNVLTCATLTSDDGTLLQYFGASEDRRTLYFSQFGSFDLLTQDRIVELGDAYAIRHVCMAAPELIKIKHVAPPLRVTYTDLKGDLCANCYRTMAAFTSQWLGLLDGAIEHEEGSEHAYIYGHEVQSNDKTDELREDKPDTAS